MLLPTILAAAGLVGAAAPQQDPVPDSRQDPRLERSLIFGSVVDAAGKPWVGADVVFESWPHPGATWGDGDLVRTVTDERGRFRAQAVRGWAYKVWAQQTMADGRLRVSAVSSDVQTGDPVDLEEAHAGLAGISVVVAGDREAWSALEPLSLEWETVAPVGRHRVPLPQDGRLEIPPWVGSLTVRVLGDNGQQILRHQAQPSPSEEPAPVKLELATPKRHLLFVHKESSDTPIAGAKLVAFDDSMARPLGETDENGLLEVLHVGDEWDAWGHRVLAPGLIWGFAEARDAVPEGKNQERAQKIVDAGGRYLTAGLCPANSVRGAVAVGEGAPLAGVDVVIVSEAHGQVDDGSYYGSNATWSVQSDAKGAFAADQIYNHSPGEVWAFLSEVVLLRLPEAWRKGLRRRVLLGQVDKKDTDLGTIDLTRDLMPWDIFVETPEGLPADGATVQVDSTMDDYKLPAMRADRTGWLRLLLPRRGPISFTIRHDSGTLMYRGAMKPTSDAVPERVPAWRARLDIGMVVRGVVADRDGKPVSGASIWIHPDHPFKLTSEEGAAFTVGPVQVTAEAGDPSGHSYWNIVSTSAKTDAEGKYEVRVPRGSGGLRFQVNGTTEILQVAGDDEYTLDIEVPKGG